MAIDYTTTALLSLVRLRGMLSDTDTTFTDANILALMNDELAGYVVPTLMGWSQEYFVAISDTTTTSGTASYAIPSRSVNTDVRDVQVIDQNNTTYHSIPRIEPMFANAYGTGSGVAKSLAYYVQNNSVVLVPTPSAAFALRIKYWRRPNQLVLVGSGAEIILTVSTPSITMASTTDLDDAPLVADVIKNSPPFDSTVDDQTYTVSSGTALAGLATPIAAGQIVAGYYFCVAGQSPVPQIPVELVPLLVARTVAAIYGAKADPRAPDKYAEAARVEAQAFKMMPRTDGLPRRIVNRYAPGFAQVGMWNRFFGGN